jgi:hypothetical protein
MNLNFRKRHAEQYIDLNGAQSDAWNDVWPKSHSWIMVFFVNLHARAD